MALLNIGYEPLRTTKLSMTFTGVAGAGANGTFSIDSNPAPFLDEDEFIMDVFYRVKTTLTSGDTAGTYLKVGLNVDDDDCVLTSTTGVVDTLNSNASGIKIVPGAYTQSTADAREIIAEVGGTNDITAGEIEIILVIARANPVTPSTYPTITIPAP